MSEQSQNKERNGDLQYYLKCAFTAVAGAAYIGAEKLQHQIADGIMNFPGDTLVHNQLATFAGGLAFAAMGNLMNLSKLAGQLFGSETLKKYQAEFNTAAVMGGLTAFEVYQGIIQYGTGVDMGDVGVTALAGVLCYGFQKAIEPKINKPHEKAVPSIAP